MLEAKLDSTANRASKIESGTFQLMSSQLESTLAFCGLIECYRSINNNMGCNKIGCPRIHYHLLTSHAIIDALSHMSAPRTFVRNHELKYQIDSFSFNRFSTNPCSLYLRLCCDFNKIEPLPSR